MEATADNLLNQVAQVFLDKLDKQNLDPKFLQNFLNSLTKRISISESSAIPQTTPAPPEEDKNSLTGQIKQAYKELIKDLSYITEYKKFTEKVFGKNLLGGLGNKEEGRTSLIEKEKKPQEVILAGFTEKASKSLKDKFSGIFKGLFDKFKGGLESPKGGMGLLGGGIALLLGGLAALVAGLMSDGPFKGILKILAKTGIQGAIKVLELAAKTFMKSLKGVVMAPINLLRSVAKSIGKIFGKGAFKAIIAPIRGLTGIFTKMLGGLVRFITPFLKKLPLIGTVISWGFAYSRFKSGDVVGGIIDVLSGIASIFPGVGTAIAIGLDVLNAFLDIKSGGSDKKASDTKRGWVSSMWDKLKGWLYEKTINLPIIGPLIKSFTEFGNGNILKGFKQLAYINPLFETIGALLGDKETTPIAQGSANVLKTVGNWVNSNIRNIPIIGPLFKAFDEFANGNILKGFKQLAYINPLFETIGALLGDKETTPIAQGSANVLKTVGNFFLKIREAILKSILNLLPEKILGISIRNRVAGLLGINMGTVTDEQATENKSSNNENLKDTVSSPQKRKRSKPMAEGGIVTEPIEATVGEAGPEAIVPLKTGGVVTQSTIANIGEAGPEAVIPLDKYFNTENISLNNDTLQSIAANTGDTNSSLKILSEALYKLAVVIDRKMSGTDTTTIINTPESQSQQPPSAATVARNNIDSIRSVRQQFRQMQFA